MTMTTFGPPTERTGPLTLIPRHLTEDATVWWVHTLIHTLTFLLALGVWHVRYEWHQLTRLDRVALIGAVVLVVSAVAGMVML